MNAQILKLKYLLHVSIYGFWFVLLLLLPLQFSFPNENYICMRLLHAHSHMSHKNLPTSLTVSFLPSFSCIAPSVPRKLLLLLCWSASVTALACVSERSFTLPFSLLHYYPHFNVTAIFFLVKRKKVFFIFDKRTISLSFNVQFVTSLLNHYDGFIHGISLILPDKPSGSTFSYSTTQFLFCHVHSLRRFWAVTSAACNDELPLISLD